MKYEHHIQAHPPASIEEIIREEMNLQCSAAREHPRSLRDFERRAIALATMDEHMAGSCLNSLPVARQGGRMAYLPAIGCVLAEVIGATYGNLRINSILVEDTPQRARARGFALDMEGNFGVSCDVVELTGAMNEAPRIKTTRQEIASVAVAKARRDAILLVAPRTVCRTVHEACFRVAFGNPEAHARSMARIAVWRNVIGIREERIWRALGIAGEQDLSAEGAATLLGLRNAISDGATTLDEAFPEDLQPPKFIPPRDGVPVPAGGEPRSSASSAMAQLFRLLEACQVTPGAILDYLREKGQGTYRSLNAAPEAVLACVVRAWPDVVAELACGRVK